MLAKEAEVMERNKFDNSNCMEIGENAQMQFNQIANKQGFNVILPTVTQDINEHWDSQIEKEGQCLKVDVKAMKRLKREDSEVQDEWTWIELHGVRPYDAGWLYNGKSDLIAFEKKNSFVLVKRTDLIAILPSLIDMNSLVSDVADARYKIYQRYGRPDKISLIELNKLEPIKWAEFPK